MKFYEHIFAEGIEYKHCFKCDCYKPVYEFQKCRSTRDGYYSNCKSCEKLRYESRREQLKVSNRKYREKNRDRLLMMCKDYYTKHRDELMSRQIEYNKIHREEQRAHAKLKRDNLKESNPLYYKAIKMADSSNQRANSEKLEVDDVYNLLIEHLDAFNNSCPCCGIPYNNNICKHKVTIDHIIPLSRNGANNIDNIRFICFSCNSKKNNKIIREE